MPAKIRFKLEGGRRKINSSIRGARMSSGFASVQEDPEYFLRSSPKFSG
ncbi:hypothetical protein C900_04565 [Fulvivirga imtechensis AK7]|uniref:Uncharacterized protein n=1 Tax=Fulvivirga imtechensis AK7 TaxID=1237149 RepID=L8JR91_9BACT|nr:hypothetical protein C900_04565 [Fulvivirga imtechensis AK7]